MGVCVCCITDFAEREKTTIVLRLYILYIVRFRCSMYNVLLYLYTFGICYMVVYGMIYMYVCMPMTNVFDWLCCRRRLYRYIIMLLSRDCRRPSATIAAAITTTRMIYDIVNSRAFSSLCLDIFSILQYSCRWDLLEDIYFNGSFTVTIL